MKLVAVQTSEKALPDLLNYGSVVAPGVVLGKDGALIAGWLYRGEDLASNTDDELNAMATRLNHKFASLGSGWTLHVDTIREQTTGYPEHSALHFPDAITAMIDEERRLQYSEAQRHYENVYVLCLSYLPPLVVPAHNVFHSGPQTAQF